MTYEALLLSLSYLFAKIELHQSSEKSVLSLFSGILVPCSSSLEDLATIQEASSHPTALGLVPLLCALTAHCVSLSMAPVTLHGYCLLFFEFPTLRLSP